LRDRTDIANRITERRFDLHHVCAQIGHDAGGIGTHAHAGEIEDAKCHAAGRS